MFLEAQPLIRARTTYEQLETRQFSGSAASSFGEKPKILVTKLSMHKNLRVLLRATYSSKQYLGKGSKCWTFTTSREKHLPTKTNIRKVTLSRLQPLLDGVHIPFPYEEFKLLSGISTDNYKPKMGTRTCKRGSCSFLPQKGS